MLSPANTRFDSWKEIAKYLDRDIRTVRRWEQERGLPVHRVPGAGRRAVYAFRSEIDAWLTDRMPQLADTEGLRPGDGAQNSFQHVLSTKDTLQTSVESSTYKTTTSDSVARLLTPTVAPSRQLRFVTVAASTLILAAVLVVPWMWTRWSLRAYETPGGDQLKITSVSSILAQRDQTIVIQGTGLGLHTPYRNADSPFIAIRDKTAGWAAGRLIPQNWDEVTLDVTSWEDTQIVIAGFSGAYGSGNWKLASGDKVEIAVWNPQSGKGPALYQLTVGSIAK